jgi:flagellar export protein FliJ
MTGEVGATSTRAGAPREPMRPFTFRAQPALDLRRSQEKEAQGALAAAEARRQEAREALDASVAHLHDIMCRGHEADTRPGELTTRIWYRNWIAGQRQHVERCRHAFDQRCLEVEEAARRAQLARRKVKTLERFRDRSWHRYQEQARRHEQKGLDELGTIRFALGRSGPGGHP